MEKGRNCSCGAISPLFHNILSPVVRFLYVKTGTRFSLQDKRLFEIREKKITRVHCIFSQGCPMLKYLCLKMGHNLIKDNILPKFKQIIYTLVPNCLQNFISLNSSDSLDILLRRFSCAS